MRVCKCGRKWYSPSSFAAHCRWSPECRLDPADIIATYVRVDDETGCWMWEGHSVPSKRSPNWYGRLSVNGRKWAAHRWAYEVILGKEILEGHELDHMCQTTLCINPTHLEPVDKAEHERRTRTRMEEREAAKALDPLPTPW